ncbi:hypothetical protein [Pedobacter jeongneungensis]|uniref:hypothetical protein n=1 Tax=Pedobacter jeongneungensis TaxID=947309 RepID=UPI0004691905|nr:hypothetical protein [Pedobacter jeongneungensis]
MATFNWTDQAGLVRKYPFNDDIRLSNFSTINQGTAVSGFAFTSLSGNDELGDGSPKRPWKSISGTPNIAHGSWLCILSSGTYRGMIARPSHYSYYADGDVTVDNSIIGEDNVTVRIFGLKFINSYNNFVLDQCRFCTLEMKNGQLNDSSFSNNIVSSTSTIRVNGSSSRRVNTTGQNTFVSCSKIQVYSDPENIWNSAYFSIFSNCHIDFTYGEIPDVDYSLFHNCTFSVSGGEPVAIESLTDFLEWAQSVNPKINRAGWTHCMFANPKFNNPGIGDYSLAFDSPAKNLSYFGTYIGAVSIGQSLKASTLESESGFDADTNVNLTINENSIELTNKTQDAVIETKVIPNLNQRELLQAPLYGFNADRNGQYIDSIADLATTTVAAGINLSPVTPYQVENAAIVYNGSTIQPGEKFTTTGVTSFTTESDGVCREILEAPQRHTIMARFSNGGNQKNAGNPLTAGYWYYVNGTITYNGVEHTNKTFKAVNTDSFTGTGTLIEAMTDQSYQHYEPHVKFSSNNVGDTRLGEIIRGNGDPDYVRGEGKEFPINAKFIQVKYMIRVNNLRP